MSTKIDPELVKLILQLASDVIPNILDAINRGETKFVLPLDQYDAKLKITRTAEDALKEQEGK